MSANFFPEGTTPLASDPTGRSLKKINALLQEVVQGDGTPDASTTVKGKIQIATDAEVQTGADTARAVVPSALAAFMTWFLTQTKSVAGAWSFLGNLVFGTASGNSITINAGTITAANATNTSADRLANCGALDALFGSSSPVQGVPAGISLREYFATGSTTSGSIGALGWSVYGTGATALYVGASGALALSVPITSSLNTGSLSFANTTYTGQDFSSYTTRLPDIIASFSSGRYEARNRSLCFGFVGTGGGNYPTLQTVTPPNSYGVRYIPPATTWAATAVYAVGANAKPTSPTGLKYICTTAGTSSGSEPTWPSTVGGTVADGTVTWTCAGADGRADHAFEFFHTGADPIASITTAASAVTMSASANVWYAARIRRTATGLYCSINGESEVFLATTTSFTGRPAFIARPDLSPTAPNSLWGIEYFGLHLPTRR